MAPYAGEDVTASLIADVHYYFSHPASRPPHHRFEKASHICVYENAETRQARLQILNKFCISSEDAFTGLLNDIELEYSCGHSCLVTLKTPCERLSYGGEDDWLVWSYEDDGCDGHHFIWSIDFYFYTSDDALYFVDTVRRVLPEQQVRITDMVDLASLVTSPQNDLVESLERIAIEGNSAVHEPRDPGVDQHNTNISRYASPIQINAPASSALSVTDAQTVAPYQAYNPAAPTAPETVTHREKTPPPEEDVDIPARQLLMSDPQTYPGSASLQSTYFPGPPRIARTGNANPAMSPPPPAPPSHTVTIPSDNFLPFSQPGYSGFRSGLQSPPVHSPSFSTSVVNTVVQPHERHEIPPSLQAQPRSFSSYSYDRAPQSQLSDAPSIHHDLYVPTKEEVQSGGGATKGRLEARADRLEKGVSGFLKKLERKYL